MQNPINIHLLSRATEPDTFNRLWQHASGNHNSVKSHEIHSLRALADGLMACGTSIQNLDGFFFGYTIPQISKEFDLLKFTENSVLDIELKSQNVPLESIAAQLQQNRYYLSHLQKETALFTVVTDSMTCYTLDKHGRLRQVPLNKLAEHIEGIGVSYLSGIEGMFRPSRFLVSPLNEPTQFIRKEYFLTGAQEAIARDVLRQINKPAPFRFISLVGRPGSGKTLLLYDIAREVSRQQRVLVIHCGKLTKGQLHISTHLRNFRIVEARQLTAEPNLIEKYDVIAVDETQRIYLRQFYSLCDAIKKQGKICIFCSDPGQVLSTAEYRNAITERIAKLPRLSSYKLTERIRTNKELTSFVLQALDLDHTPHFPTAYPNVTLSYANSAAEAKQQIAYFRGNGYTFINFSKSNKAPSPYAQYEEDCDTHHAIGQEFDKVLLLLDGSFYYDADRRLQAAQHPNPNYLYTNLFYQGASRVREKLALIIVDAPQLFKDMTTIFDGTAERCTK